MLYEAQSPQSGEDSLLESRNPTLTFYFSAGPLVNLSVFLRFNA